MFTGIVQAKGHLKKSTRTNFGVRLIIDRRAWQPAITFTRGDSICVSGVCLTLVEFDADTMSFDVIPETLAKTSLGALAVGDAVNLEPSVTATTPMGGHFMQGHVDGTGVVAAVETKSEYRVRIRPSEALRDYIVDKGSIAVDGVSLTIASVNKDGTFDVALIPTTLELTTLSARKAGDLVNLEADILAKTVVAYLRRHARADEPR